jgi:hypothetical protein
MITLIAPSAALIVISKLEIFDRVLSTVHIPLELVLQVPADNGSVPEHAASFTYNHIVHALSFF